MERNFAVLLNRLPAERRNYARLSQTREATLRASMEHGLDNMELRFWHGEIASWGRAGELDLVIIDDKTRHCLVLELKSFLAPAEPREVRDRSEEIAKGVHQVRDRRERWSKEPNDLFATVQATDGYTACFAVASKTSIGAVYAQDPTVPVVGSDHLVEKIRRDGLPAACEWLTTRSYLPVQGRHFDIETVDAEIAGWHLQWYGIKPLVEHYF